MKRLRIKANFQLVLAVGLSAFRLLPSAIT